MFFVIEFVRGGAEARQVLHYRDLPGTDLTPRTRHHLQELEAGQCASGPQGPRRHRVRDVRLGPRAPGLHLGPSYPGLRLGLHPPLANPGIH